MGLTDDNVNVQITGSVAGLVTAMETAGAVVKESTGAMAASMGAASEVVATASAAATAGVAELAGSTTVAAPKVAQLGAATAVAARAMALLEIEALKMDAALAPLAAASVYASRAVQLLEIEAYKTAAALEAEAAAARAAAAAAQTVGAKVGALKDGLTAALAPLLALMTAFAAFHAITDAVDEVTNLAVSLDVLSAKTGLSVEALTALHGAATLGNLPIEELNGGMQRLARGMDEAAGGTGPVADAFKRLGVSATDANGQLRPTRDVLLSLADRFATLEDGAAKTAIGIAIFGRGFDALGQFLNKGSEGIKALEDQTRSLNGVMTGEAQAALLAYDDAMDALEITTGALKRQFVVGLAPALTVIAQAFTSGTDGMDLMSMAARGLGNAMREIVIVGTAVVGILKMIGAGATGNFAQMGIDMAQMLKTMRDLWSEPDPTAAKGAGGGGVVPGSAGGGGKDQDRLQRALEESADLMTAAKERWRKENQKVQDELEQSWVETFESIPRAWNNAILALRGTTAGWGDFFREMLRSLGLEYAAFWMRNTVIHNAAWLQQKKTAAAGYAFMVLESLGAAMKMVAHYAAVAAAATWAALAGIPFVGPVLAPLAALGALAGVLALAHGMTSAEHGFDVPAGVNPVTQLHAQEMVLPADLANKVRGMSGEGGGGHTYHIHALDAKSFAEFADRNYAAFGSAVRKAAKYGAMG